MNKCVICLKDTKLKCSICKSIYYCSREHQMGHYKYHKLLCNIKLVPFIQPVILDKDITPLIQILAASYRMYNNFRPILNLVSCQYTQHDTVSLVLEDTEKNYNLDMDCVNHMINECKFNNQYQAIALKFYFHGSCGPLSRLLGYYLYQSVKNKVLTHYLNKQIIQIHLISCKVTSLYNKLFVIYVDGNDTGENKNTNLHQVIAIELEDHKWYSIDISAAQYDLFDNINGSYFRIEEIKFKNNVRCTSYFEEFQCDIINDDNLLLGIQKLPFVFELINQCTNYYNLKYKSTNTDISIKLLNTSENKDMFIKLIAGTAVPCNPANVK